MAVGWVQTACGVAVEVLVAVIVGVLVGVFVAVPVAVGVGGHPVSTVMVPVMTGWMVHMYE